MTLDDEKSKFLTVAKRMLKTDVSTNKDTLLGYKVDIIQAYIEFVTFCNQINETRLDNKQKLTLSEARNYIYGKFEECLIQLKCSYDLSANLLDLPDPDKIKIIGIEIDENDLNKTIFEDSDDSHSPHRRKSPETPDIMSENSNFIRLCASTINSNYKGDPLELQAFLNSVALLQDLATAGQTDLLFKFIKSKLAGKALEAIRTTDTTIEQILNSLRAKVKNEPSQVIKGRFTALRQEKYAPEEFSKKLEALAEAFQRSLISEGFPEIKANEMTIETTVSLCREMAPSDITKSVLSATAFKTPQEVVAKFITENDKTLNEKKVFAYKSSFSKNKNTSHNQNSSNRNQNFGQNQNFNRNKNFNRNRNPNNNFNNSSNNSNNSNNGNRRHNGNGNQNWNQNNRNGQWYGRNNRNIRMTNAENTQVPQETLEDTNQGSRNHNQYQMLPS